MFKIKTDYLGRFLRFMLANAETGEYVSIVPGFGGNVNRIVLSKNYKNYSILDGARTESELIRNAWFKGAKLIPFPNRVSNGQYSFAGRPYQLPINFGRHAIHGFLYNKSLEVTHEIATADQAAILLEYVYDGSLPGYHFSFRVAIRHSLTRDRGFEYETTVTNLSRSTMPLGDGWHPYFKTTGNISKLSITIPSKCRIQVDEEMIPTGRLIPEEYDSAIIVGNKEFDTGFTLDNSEGKASTEIYNPELDLRIIVWQETGKWKYNYLQVFIPPDRRSIAVEPMTCAADAFNNRIGIIVLEPQQSFAASCGVCLA